VVVEFLTLDPSLDFDGRGPIYGEFWANDEVLSFDGADPANCAAMGESECGYYLRSYYAGYGAYSLEVGVGELFQAIRHLLDRRPELSYEVPSSTTVNVDLPEGEDLSIGFSIYELHNEGEDSLVCGDRWTVDYDELRDAPRFRCPPYYDDAGDPIYTCGRVVVSISVLDWQGGG
jgi:hypothetical protein